MEDERNEHTSGLEPDLHAPGRRLDLAFAALADLPPGSFGHALHRMGAVEPVSPAIRGRFPFLRFVAAEEHPLAAFDEASHPQVHQAWLSACLGADRIGRARGRTIADQRLLGTDDVLPAGWYDLVLVDLVGLAGIDAVIVGLVPTTPGAPSPQQVAPAAASWFHGTSNFRVRLDPSGRIQGATMNVGQVLDRSVVDLHGSPLVDHLAPEDRHRALQVIAARDADERQVRVRVLTVDHGPRWYELTLWWITEPDRPTWGIADFREAQAQVEAEAAARAIQREFHAHDRLVQMLGQVDDMVLLASDEHGIVYRNEAARALFRKDPDGFRLFDAARPLIHAELDPLRSDPAGRGGRWVGDVDLETPDGSLTLLTTVNTVVDEDTGEVFYGIVMRDVTAERAHEAELSHQARRDHLTGMPNRLALIEHLEGYRHPARPDGTVTLCFVDLDNLKIVNDGLGHNAGDRLLIASGAVLDALEDTAMVARFGGDEFVVVYEDLDDADTEHRARAILDVIRGVDVAGVASGISASVGIAVAPRRGLAADRIIREADAAMYAAKRAGRARHARFDERMRDQVTRRFLLEADLRRFLHDGGPDLALQPLIDTATGEVMSLESLARWGDHSPGEFIPVAEDSGLIVPLGDAMLERSLAALARLRDAHDHLSGLHVGINVSARQLLEPTYPVTVLETIAASGIDPGSVVLELTESVLIDPSDEVDAALRKVREGGVRLSLDDFGSGYSSLAYLRRYPIDSLKLDITYIQMLGDHETRVIAEAVVTMAMRLGLTVVAEGVETPEQLHLVREIGIPLAQGFLLGRPASIEALVADGLHPRLGGLSPLG